MTIDTSGSLLHRTSNFLRFTDIIDIGLDAKKASTDKRQHTKHDKGDIYVLLCSLKPEKTFFWLRLSDLKSNVPSSSGFDPKLLREHTLLGIYCKFLDWSGLSLKKLDTSGSCRIWLEPQWDRLIRSGLQGARIIGLKPSNCQPFRALTPACSNYRAWAKWSSTHHDWTLKSPLYRA